jgi:hypothetical protein
LTRSIVAFVAFLVVLTLASSASAQSAWVLWMETVIGNTRNLRADSGWPDQESCERYAGMVRVPVDESDETMTLRFICLPETVDPRGADRK